METLSRRISFALRSLGTLQVLCGLCAAAAILLFVSHEMQDVVGDEIMMSGRVIQLTAMLLMFFVIASGIVSLFRLRWGWVFSFFVATLVLLMALLMGPGTIPVTKWSFLGLMALSLINWADAVVFYYYDLYT